MNEQGKVLTKKDLSYKPKMNYSYFIASSIMEALCYKNEINKFYSAGKYKEDDFFLGIENESEVNDILKKKDNILKEATRIFRVLDILEYEKKKYNLSTKKWFLESRFYIYDIKVLKELCPILLYYVGNDSESSYITFFDRLDILVEFVLKPSLNHNNISDIEGFILDKIDNLDEVEIIDEDGNKIFVIAKQIKFNRKSKNEIEKILVYEDNNTSEHNEITIDRVVYQKQVSFQPITKIDSKNFSMFNIDNKKENEIEVILECDSIVYEYYKLKPLKSMNIFETEDRLKELSSSIEFIKLKPNKFYITAIDTEEMIISTLLHTLPHTKVIEPFELNEKIIKKFKKFSNDLDIDLCSEDTPPTSPKKPNKNSSIKEEKTDKKINNENKKIGGDGAIEEIKKDNDNLNLDF
ncbi:hypothetical protein CP985_04140 [Malaciobacter mytili LMG 24559]|uniref:Uncharacterized protein n=1 Tax=Malaciobacter mytili LMG 24559 TaxID=1032238 RepID=A0AAX2AJW6_9BACT|nr:hypothetical protein [Malaciobacter mytili]AXH13744.1 hypothetical protein AMYT_0119 [Malaciobacter mytili LMG 24559]RXK16353.1 hypothetical protein CP985_04140 [Malaciobacter mytili LMG 24559]